MGENKPSRLWVSLSTDVYAASINDRANKRFSEIVNAVLRRYYFPEGEMERQKLTDELESLQARELELRSRLAAIEVKAAQEAVAGQRGVGLRESILKRLKDHPNISVRTLQAWAEVQPESAGLSLAEQARIIEDVLSGGVSA